MNPLDFSGNSQVGGSNPLSFFEQPKPKPKQEEPSYASRVLNEGLPAVANIAQDIALSIPAGIRGAGEAIATGSMERGKEGFESSMETLQGTLPRFRSQGAQEAQQALGEGLGAVQEAGGSALNWLGRRQMDLMGVKLDPRTEILREAATRTVGEAGTALAPIPGLEGAAGALSRAPLVGSVARGAARGSKEYGSWNFPKQEPVPPTLMQGPDQGGAAQPYLFADQQGIPQDVRSPYNLQPGEAARISEEIRKATEGGPQGDLFTGYRPDPSTTGGIGKRDTIAGPDLEARGVRGTEGQFDSSLTDTEYTGPRQQGIPDDNGIPYRRYDPEGINQLNEAEDTPGFLQTAEHKIALRFDRIRQLETSSDHAIEKLKLEEKNAKLDADAATEALAPIPVPKEVQVKAEEQVSRNPDARYTEYLPTGQVWLLRDHNRLTDPKSDHQFAGKEASVLKNGVNEPLEIKYSTADGKAVLTNGNTRASLAMKHGLPEIPVRVTVVDRPLSGTEAINGVPVGKFDLPKGNAKPSDIGLAGRVPKNAGPIGRQRGAIDLSTRRQYQQRLNELHDKVNRGEELNPREEESRKNLFRSLNGGPPTAGFKGFGQRGTVGSDLNKTQGPRTPKDILEVVKKLGTEESRPMQQIIDESGISRDTLTDFGSAETEAIRGMLKSAGRAVFDLRSDRAFAEGTPLEPIMTALEKRVSRIDLDGKLRLDADLRGTGYSVGRIDKLLGRDFEHRLGSEDGALPALDKVAKLGTKESSDFVNTWNKYTGETNDIPFTNPKAREAYEAIHKVLDGRLDSINPKRVALGKPEVSPIPGYMPFVREAGDYILTTLDKATGKKSLYVFPSMRKAQQAAEGLKKDFPDLTIGEAQHKRLDKLEDVHLSALYDTARALQEGDPLAKAVNKAINSYFTQRGAGGHFRTRSRERIGGYLGETGDIGELRKGIVSYFEYLNNYESNLDRALIQKELDSAKVSGPPEPNKSIWKQNQKTGGWYQEDQTNSSLLRDAAPVFHKFATNVLMKSRGALEALDQFDKSVVEELGKGLQLGESAVQRGIYKLNNVATVGFLSKTSFWLSQFFQHPMMTPPRLMYLLKEVRGDQGLLGEIASTPMDAARMSASMVKSYAFTLFPWLDKSRADVINYATKHGYVDPSLSHMLEAPGAYDPYSKRFYQYTGNLEREVVRIPSLLAIEDFLRPYIKDPQQRYEVASGQMFRAMAGTTRSNSPLVYHSLGPFGSMMRTLKSYSTNWHGQMAEYMGNAAKSGMDMSSMKVLGVFAGTNALYAGILGVLGVAEATALITLYNALTNSNVRTPQEWFATNGNTEAARAAGGVNIGPDLTDFFANHPTMKNVAIHGFASSLFGRDMTAQVAPPDLTQLLSIVPAKVPLDIAGPLVEYSIATAQDQMTDQNRMRLWQGLTLNNPHARGIIERMFQQPGQPVPRAHMNMSGNFYRDQEGFQGSQSYTSAIAGGMMTLPEKQVDLLYHFFKMNESRLEKDRAATLNSMTDDILSGGEIKPEKIEKYVQQFGDPKNLKKDIADTLVKRNMTGLQYETVKGSKHGGLGYAGKAVHMQPYLQNPLDFSNKP